MTDYTENTEQTISLSEIFNLIKANILLIILVTFATTAIAAGYAFTQIETKYSSQAEMVVLLYPSSSEGEGNPNYQITPGQLVETTVNLIQSDTIINELRSRNTVVIPEGMTNSSIKKATTVTSKPNVLVIVVKFTHTNKEFAQEMANELSQTMVDYLSSRFNGDFTLSNDASNPIAETSNKLLYTIVGGLIGLVLSGTIILLNRLFKNTYRTKEELEAGINVLVLGVVPEYEVKESGKK